MHVRNTTGTKEKFFENFPDEGQTDLYQIIKTCHEVGYKGHLTPDHCIRVEGDSAWGHRYWGYALGFIKALMMAAQAS